MGCTLLSFYLFMYNVLQNWEFVHAQGNAVRPRPLNTLKLKYYVQMGDRLKGKKQCSVLVRSWVIKTASMHHGTNSTSLCIRTRFMNAGLVS